MPKFYDFISEDNYSLLIIEYIEGKSLYEKARASIRSRCFWPDPALLAKTELINYALDLYDYFLYTLVEGLCPSRYE